MDRLQDCLSPNREVIEQRAGQSAEGIVFMDPAVAVYQLDDHRFWPNRSERPDGLIIGQRADGSWWVCFVELKHRALPEGFQKFSQQVQAILALHKPEALAGIIRRVTWNIEELRQLNRGQRENLDDAYQDLITARDTHYDRLEGLAEELKTRQHAIAGKAQGIDLAEARVKAFGAHTKSLIGQARHQLLAGVWHFMNHRKCHGAEYAEARHGDAHHRRWAQGRDLPPGMRQGDQSKDHKVATVVVLLQRSGSRSISLLERDTSLPRIGDALRFGDEGLCAAKPVAFRVLPTHLQSMRGRFVRIFEDMEEFLSECNVIVIPNACEESNGG
jgi:hypothetical protein